jgi:protoheme IX farnesyltransferase
MAGRGERLIPIDALAFARLAKLPLAAFIALSTLFGAIVAGGRPTLEIVPVVLGVLFVACGGATLNSLQERSLDATMQRTRERPLPAGQVRPAQALWQAVLLIGGGMLLQAVACKNPWPLLLTATALLFYNGVYTPLKSRTTYAIIPGLISGALPPYIGWIGGGGEFLAFLAILLIVLLVLWQVPHFHLILLANQEDYHASPLPHLLRRLSEASLRRLFIPWVGSLACVMMMFAVVPQAMTNLCRIAVVANALVLVLCFLQLDRVATEKRYHYLFLCMNVFLVLHMGFVATGRILGTMG